MSHPFALPRELPAALAPLGELALDLRWTWSHAADALWRTLAPAAWERSANPWAILQDVPTARLEEVAADPRFVAELERLAGLRREHLAAPGWYARTHPQAEVGRVAYFCMEFGLGEALPLYAGGLGVLAGDFLKAASDLGLPVVGVGLLYQEGYYRQVLDADGRQSEAYPYNDPTTLPVRPVLARGGGWLHVTLDLPGRPLYLRVWQVQLGRVPLYLLDSNDSLNSPVDRTITGRLYDAGHERRLMQEIVLGVGGWRALEALGVEVDVCHLNEGHAAFAILERARAFMRRAGTSFREALWATRAGNVFTTHTAVPAGFDRYGPELIRHHVPLLRQYAADLGVSATELLGLGRLDPRDEGEPFNMAYLAIRGSAVTNGVSALHGAVSRRLFAPLFPRWPEREVPVTHVTNGVHVPSWDSPAADGLWERCCGKDRWLGGVERLGEAIRAASDEELWAVRGEARHALVRAVRSRVVRQHGYRGEAGEAIAAAARVLDPDVLTLGFARRFAAYKRPTLLLADPARLVRLLTDPRRPMQLVLAGKPHPADGEGKALVAEWAAFARRPGVCGRVAFLEDYDVDLARELVSGVDVWLNTPRRPWEACGTSGMKVLANGGLNLSALDGWWDEAYGPELGWAIEGADDRVDAARLYEFLEREVGPAFYARDEQGVPRRWVARIRASMATLAPRFSTNRMVAEYLDRLYVPAAERLRGRVAGGARTARELAAWWGRVADAWPTLRFGDVRVCRRDGRWHFAAEVHLGRLDPEAVRVELCADAVGTEPAVAVPMTRHAPAGAREGVATFAAAVPDGRPSTDYTPRVVPWHPDAVIPLEAPLTLWQR
jgi:starch phosphorylase